MKKILLLIIFLAASITMCALAKSFSNNLCSLPGYTCFKIQRGDTWQGLWPDPQSRRIVMRLNRVNTRLQSGMVIAVPRRLGGITHMDVSPMPYAIEPHETNIIMVNMRQHAFGAYDKNGNLIHWGPVSGGRGWCPDVYRTCNTPQGNFLVFSKGSASCKSSKYPVPEGGAPMPFCMYFYRGFAMHAGDLPGYHDSHGCVRMFYEDAEWLNKNFISTGKNGTRVIVN